MHMHLSKLTSSQNNSKTFLKVITSSTSVLLEDKKVNWIGMKFFLGVCLMSCLFEANVARVWTDLKIGFFTLGNFVAQGGVVLFGVCWSTILGCYFFNFFLAGKVDESAFYFYLKLE